MQKSVIDEPSISLSLLHNDGLYATSGYAELVSTKQQRYIARRLSPYDARQDKYQQLRADIFVRKFGWDIPIDDQGRERDTYDISVPANMTAHCVFLRNGFNEYLVSGVRICELSCWEDSMTFNEFTTVGMIPPSVRESIQAQYQPQTMLELTRLCVRNTLIDGIEPIRIDAAAVRDYTYATFYALAEHCQRPFALAIVDRLYWSVLQRTKTVFNSVYTNFSGKKGGYALIVLDLKKSIPSLRAAGHQEQAARMLALCQKEKD